MFKSIYSKITLGIIITVVIIISAVGISTFNQIENGFQTFLISQEREGFGIGRNQNEELRIEKHEQIINEFKSTIQNSILFSSTAGLGLSLIIGLLISKQLVHPIVELKKKVSQVTKNKYNLLEMKTSTKEIQDLIDQYNSLIKELKRVESLREELVSDVAHELKTPITKIRGQIEGCIDGIYTCDEKQLNKVISNIEQLELLISELQNLIQIKSKSVVLKKEKINLYEFIQGVISGFESKDIKIINSINLHETILADKRRFREIMDNLISNSLKYTKKGSITIDFKNKVLSVKDTGIGISSKDLPYIFERFYRADKSRNKQTGGLGLGLSIVKELIEKHGWEISARSKLNGGTTIYINVKN